MEAFKKFPPEVRLEIWRFASLVDYPNGPINIYPPCYGVCEGTSWSWRNDTFSQQYSLTMPSGVHPYRLRVMMLNELAQKSRHRQKTPFPITTRINRESRAETFRYWELIEPRFREMGRLRVPNTLCFVPSYHHLVVDWCCFVNPNRFGNWIKHLKEKYPGRMEQVTDFGIANICWHGKFGLGRRIEDPAGGTMKAAKELGHEKQSIAHDLLSSLLEFPRLETLCVDFLEIFHCSQTVNQNERMLGAIRSFLELQTFKKGVPKLHQLSCVQKGH